MKKLSVAVRVLFACGFTAAVAISCRANDDTCLPSAPSPTAAISKLKPVDLAALSASPLRAPAVGLLLGASRVDERSPVASRPAKSESHAFWDRENIALFSLVGASRGIDYSSTLNMRRRGRDEILLTNDIVDNHPAFAAIEAGGAAVSIGASYLFHRYHHHRLERWTSIVHASLTTTGAVRNYCLKTAHPSTTP